MKFTTNKINAFGNILQVKMPILMAQEVQDLQAYIDKGNRITIDIKRERRSNNANAYAWVLCHAIAETLSKGKTSVSKEDVYRKAIRDCGHCTILPIKEEAVEMWKRIWSANGIGWITEELGTSKLPGYVNIAAYHGSSTYDTKEMTRLINGLVDECNQLGIETKSAEEINSLLEQWK